MFLEGRGHAWPRQPGPCLDTRSLPTMHTGSTQQSPTQLCALRQVTLPLWAADSPSVPRVLCWPKHLQGPSNPTTARDCATHSSTTEKCPRLRSDQPWPDFCSEILGDLPGLSFLICNMGRLNVPASALLCRSGETMTLAYVLQALCGRHRCKHFSRISSLNPPPAESSQHLHGARKFQTRGAYPQ